VAFQSFLQRDGLTQACSVTSLDLVAGRVGVACTTSDPGGTGVAAWTEGSTALLEATFTPVLSGEGTLTISSLAATDGTGQPFTDLRIANGSFLITGAPDVSMVDPVPPSAAWPGLEFEASFDLMNVGFGPANPPLLTRLYISRDAIFDPADPLSPDRLACSLSESAPLPGKATVSRTLTACRIPENIRPGLYTGFFRLVGGPGAGQGSTATIALPSRVLTVRRGSSGPIAEVRRHPLMSGDSAGAAMGDARRPAAGSIAVVISRSRNLSWMVRHHRRPGESGRLFVEAIPDKPRAHLEPLDELRVSQKVTKVLVGADIDGDGEDEPVLLVRSKKREDSLEFRRMDLTTGFPAVCPGAAVTPALGERILAAAGIQADGDPEDEIAIVTGDGALTIYNLEPAGPLPPADPCQLDARPVIAEPSTALNLIEVASDTGSGAPGDRVRSLCALDFDVDGTEEIGSLHNTDWGAQAFRIQVPPAAPGGTAILLADDPAFGGAGRNGRLRALSCTRSRQAAERRRGPLHA
jgi:hypothetical protein